MGKETVYSGIPENTMSIELIVFLSMLAVFFICSFVFKLSASLGLIAGAVVGAVVAEHSLPVDYLLEGMFTYFDTIVIIAAAILFMSFVRESGALDVLNAFAIRKFHNRPTILLLIMMAIMMFPGMIVGSSTAAVVSGGAIVYPLLMILGLPKVETAAFIAMGAILGTTAPPVNIKVMSICVAMDIPYIGFTWILLLLSVPIAVFTAIFFGRKYVKNFNYAQIESKLDFQTLEKYGWKVFIPVIVLVVLMVGPKLFPTWFPSLGMPLIFIVCAIVSVFTGKKFNIVQAAIEGINSVLPVMGILIGVGMFIQIMTLTGVRGLIVNACISLPPVLLYLAMALMIPAFGSISSLGAATVLGIPFTLAMSSGDPIIVAAGLSSIAGLGELVPPTALAGLFAARLVGLDNYLPVIKRCIVPAAVIIACGILCVMFSVPLGKLLV